MVATLMLALEVLFLKLKPLILTGIAGGLITLKLQLNCSAAVICCTAASDVSYLITMLSLSAPTEIYVTGQPVAFSIIVM